MLFSLYLVSTIFVVVSLTIARADGAGVSNDVKVILERRRDPDITAGSKGAKCLTDVMEFFKGPSAKDDLAKVSGMSEEQFAIFVYAVYGDEGIDAFCNLDVKLKQDMRKVLEQQQQEQQTNEEEDPEDQGNRRLACTAATVLYPSTQDNNDGTYNGFIITYVDPYLSGRQRTERTSPDSIITLIQTPLNVQFAAEQTLMGAQLAFNIAIHWFEIFDFWLVSFSEFLEGVNDVSITSYYTNAIYIVKEYQNYLERALYHDQRITAAEIQAVYKNTDGLTTNAGCSAQARRRLNTDSNNESSVKDNYNEEEEFVDHDERMEERLTSMEKKLELLYSRLKKA